jgi:endogenous inhibitor of DNA gyrase (YacG/DUF329 family)
MVGVPPGNSRTIKTVIHGFDADGARRAVQPVPLEPTHCRGCGSLLAPLRRYAGLCRPCVLAWGQQPRRSRQPPTQLATLLRELCRTTRTRPDGRTEAYVQVECACGRRRVLKLTTWLHHQPHCCNRCRLRGVDLHGFEAEYAR